MLLLLLILTNHSAKGTGSHHGNFFFFQRHLCVYQNSVLYFLFSGSLRILKIILIIGNKCQYYKFKTLMNHNYPIREMTLIINVSAMSPKTSMSLNLVGVYPSSFYITSQVYQPTYFSLHPSMLHPMSNLLLRTVDFMPPPHMPFLSINFYPFLLSSL